ncbi:uncharacterized protein CELE_Y54G2A.73 [Caenorhabditis elegans]|nr:Uncharacterized protein CELE_Y54G2A.73 [Caenorhabditis elegans]CDH92961.1 Uncharacterized protein CELE_Y54G2A.73 [Caenorhabditis elegans]|eukprot:NP_001294267.1 Uncharacterized protein CELE_Y54G2A.73 [Caenorhabditis elegans]
MENGETEEVAELDEKNEDDDEIAVIDEMEFDAAPAPVVDDKDGTDASSSAGTKRPKTQLEELLQQPLKKIVYQGLFFHRRENCRILRLICRKKTKKKR